MPATSRSSSSAAGFPANPSEAAYSCTARRYRPAIAAFWAASVTTSQCQHFEAAESQHRVPYRAAGGGPYLRRVALVAFQIDEVPLSTTR